MQTVASRVTLWHLKQAYHAQLKDVLGHIAIVQRLDRAYDMLTRDERYSLRYSQKEDTWCIESPNDVYYVRQADKSCTCPDAERLCKHRLAVKLLTDALVLQIADGFSVLKA